ncbi:hypothetical protein [Tepidibacter sp. Z1-5]|uniref:hypothetical protein n=1 Tax=Tepidibacter sp. Z1-5 TaxID=3134138 RepID=UPI0030BFDB7F
MIIQTIIVFGGCIYLIVSGAYKLNRKNIEHKYPNTIKDKKAFYILSCKRDIFLGSTFLILVISALLKNDILFYLIAIIIVVGGIFLLKKFMEVINW